MIGVIVLLAFSGTCFALALIPGLLPSYLPSVLKEQIEHYKKD